MDVTIIGAIHVGNGMLLFEFNDYTFNTNLLTILTWQVLLVNLV
jgi:hypothetical protein